MVNLDLDNVPIEEALERILSAHGLSYEINPGSNIFVVNKLQDSPKQLMTRIYPLKFATVPSSKLLSTLSEQGGTIESATSGIIAAISAVLSEGGSVIEDSRTNSIIVSDIPNQFPLIENTITRLDVRIPQILIEAELLDITKRTADEMGVKFGNESFLDFTPASRNTAYPFNPDKLIGDGLFSKSYTEGTLSFPALAMTLDFLRNQTDTKNLARPRILTLNNNTAEISITTKQAIGFNTTTTAQSGDTSEEPERVETGVSLKVTPQANTLTREIIMAIEPKVSDASVSQISSTVFDPETRGTKSILRVNDGDTIVLGGLLRTEESNLRTSVPVLGQIPILGAPFRHKDKTDSQRELIIFITPHIVEENMLMKTASTKPQRIAREQSIPSNRSQEIEKDLLQAEKKHSNAYR
jgi:type IV pilus assembly protein PilQ